MAQIPCVLVILLTTCFFIAHLEAARILGIIPTPSYSHQVVLRPVWRELAKRGHDLVVMTTDPMNDATLPNLREIDLHDAYQVFSLENLTVVNPISQMQEILAMSDRLIDFEMQHPEVNELLHNKTEHFDLVIVELLIPMMGAWSYRFQCPYVGVVTMDAPLYGHLFMGNPITPALYPDFMLPFAPPLSFVGRVASLIFTVVFEIIGRVFVARNTKAQLLKHFGEETPPIVEIWANLSMMFINTSPLFQTVRPLSPTTIEIGGGTQLSEPKPLPNDLQQFLDKATNGAIYFSLGSNVKSHWISKELMDVFLETLSELPYRVLWKFDVEVANLPPNVKTIKWAPQQDILRHPNVKLMIMQGGQQSTEEAVNMKVPLIVLPFFGDQRGNAQRIVIKGFGIELNKDTLTKKVFKEAINEVLTNPKYRKEVEIVSRLVKDQPMTGVEKMVWWSEYVLRNKGAKHLKSHSIDVPLYQVLYLDLIVILFVGYKLVKCGVKFVWRRFRRTTNNYSKLKSH